ncbi:MAG: anti-sigma factor [Pirellulales bacterium]|nr:anti-sigma factor [Pirellulales bacterium]
MTCRECHDLLPEYALGQCEPEVAATAEAHLRSCAACRQELAEAEAAWGALPLGLPPVAPSSELRRRVFETLDREAATGSSSRNLEPRLHGTLTSRQRAWSLALAASVLVALGGQSLWVARQHRAREAQQIAEQELAAQQLALRLGALQQGESVRPASRFQLVPADENQAGEIRVAWDQAAGQWQVFAIGVTSPPEGSDYYFWFAADGEFVGAPLKLQPGGVATGLVDLPARVERFTGAMVTVERSPAGTVPAGEPLWQTAPARP